MDFPSYVYTNGAYLVPKRVDGQWVWVVSEFDGETFGDGQLMNPTETATTLEELYEDKDDSNDE